MPATADAFVGSYSLVSANGETGDPASLKLTAVDGKADTLSVSAKVANSMRGQVTVSDSNTDGRATLKGMLMSTRMMGPPFLMTVERILSQISEDGFTIELVDSTLTLTSGEDKLVFKRN